MSATSSRSRYPGHHVTAVVLCHNNAKLLAKTLDALDAQDIRPDRVVAVDLGSTDRSVSVATDRLGASRVVELEAASTTSGAVQAGLALLSGRTDRAREDGPLEWIWLLHDDSAPDPAALDELLLRVSHSPSVWLAGPKVRDWEDRLLVQAGLTIDSAGTLDTGLDRREPDQGQRDDVDEVLAVDTAGALVRRDVWEYLGGEDPAWSEYAAAVDLGWRVNAAGGRVVVVPRAVVRHAGSDCPGDEPAGSELRAQTVRRRNGMQIVLCNTAGWLVPLLLLRYVLGGMLHALALVLLSRRPRDAAAELLAVVQVLAAPGVIVAGRRNRATTSDVSYGDLRRLFPPPGRWVASLLNVRAHSAATADAPVTRKRRVAVESGPVSEESESLGDELSAIGEFLRRPASLLLLVMSLLSLIANRHILSSSLHGGRLLPAPSGASDLWSSYLSSWHPSTVGSLSPSPPSTAVLALISTVLVGKAWLAVDVVVLGAVPLAALSAFSSLRILTTAVRIRVWVAVVYALLPAVTGAVASGRLDVIVAAIVLPRIARGMAIAWQADAPGTPRGRCVRAGLWLAVGSAFAPLLWVVAAALCGVLLAAAYLRPSAEGEPTVPVRSLLLRTAGMLAVPLVVLLPWTGHVLVHPGVLLSGSGLPEFYASRSAPSGIWLAFLHAGGTGEPPVWVGIPIVAAVALGMQRDSRVTAARVCAGLFAAALLVAVLETRGAGATTGYPATRHWPGLVLLIGGAGALTVAIVAAVGARHTLRDRSFGWRQPAVVVVVALAVVSTVTLVGSWLVRGGGGPLKGDSPAVLPLYVQAELNVGTSARALLLYNDHGLIRYALVRSADGPVLGSGDLPASGAAADRASQHLADAVRDIVAARPGAGTELVPFGIDYVVAPIATARRVASEIGQETTLTVIPVPSATVWHSTLDTGEVTVLGGTSATAARAGDSSSTSPAQVLQIRGGPTDLDADVGSGGTGRLLVLAEPATSGWHATIGGQPLQPTTAYGWAQAFELPSDGGQVHISYNSGGRHWWLLIELLALVAVLLVGAGAAPHVPHRDAP